ncbi:ABC transporter ATP-binding protein [Fundicoccus sp. Sow4_D5]|uniref:ABC transporter ATP-binding protein n=1 Tax=Fundicoccus sp. Sow4_D5 TaxID=3438782 RepID=UPI003F92BCC3
MIKADSLRLVSGSTVILDDVTVEIKRHQTTVIIGPSGCGKSSLLRVLAGWQPLTSGSLEPNLTSSEVGLLFQNYQLFPWHTVEKNLRLALQALKLTRKEQSERVKELAQTLELQSLLQKYPHQISGGQQQRVALGQLLAKEASYLFLDEPTSALDAFTKEKIQDLLVSLQKKHHLTIVWVTHSIEEAAFLGQNVWVMEEASVIKSLQNPLAASENYRQQAHYFEQQLLLRQLLGGDQR